jgi:aryl-alcohol dehydrogenase-like predicted oxidoreductase
LRWLQTDWIDLYQVGVPDPNTDIDETLDAMSDLVRAGKIRSFGASKVPASQIVEASGPPTAADTDGSAPNSRPTLS